MVILKFANWRMLQYFSIVCWKQFKKIWHHLFQNLRGSSISESSEIVFAIILIQRGIPRHILFTIAHQIFIFASQIGV